jgi:hypothetical protein
MVQKFHTFYGTRRFVISFTRSGQWTLPSDNWIHSKLSLSVSVKIYFNKIGKVHTDIPKVFFTSYYVGHCCTVVRGHRWATMRFNNTVRSLMLSQGQFAQQCVPTMTLVPIVGQHWPQVMWVVYLLGKTRQTDTDGSTRCSSLTLEREECLISYHHIYA